MAPEQAAGQGTAVGPAADFYALGAILNECLTARPPFPAATSMEVLLQVLQDESVPPRRLNPRLPRDLETICLKCLQKEPGKRYATTAALAADCAAFLHGEPIAARPAGAVERGWRWCQRKPVQAGLVLTAFFLVVALAAGVVGTSWGLVEARRARDNEAAQRQIAEMAQGLAQERLEEVTRQKQRVEEESAIAKSVNEFLQKDLLGQADIRNQPLPGGTGGRNKDITVGELLDRAAKTIEGKFAMQPQTEAAIRLTVGKAYRALGRYGGAAVGQCPGQGDGPLGAVQTGRSAGVGGGPARACRGGGTGTAAG
jgi:hypothetical protein